MHMADALLSPAVGVTLWGVSGGLMAYCANTVKPSVRDNLVPLMGVLGAFIFAAQMINFAIPLTGSSGHLGGGLLLAILLGPHAAFLVIASVLIVQAFFFADGGLLALGGNLFNLGFCPAFVAYPLIYRTIVGTRHAAPRAWAGAVLAGVAGLLLGAFSVALQTWASGISDLPFGAFVTLLMPIHLAIGVVEGLATAAVVSFVAKARPEILPTAPASRAGAGVRALLAGLASVALVTGGVASWFASAHPDGLEWSIAKVSGRKEIAGPGEGVHKRLAVIQSKTAFLPDYGFKALEGEPAQGEAETPAGGPWPAVSAGRSVSGVVGGVMTLALVCLLGIVPRWRSPARPGGGM